MRVSRAVVPIGFLLVSGFVSPVRASHEAGDIGFAASLGIADGSGPYRSDDALIFAIEYQKTGYAQYRAVAGFFTVLGRDGTPTAPSVPDADAFFVSGNLVLTPRFAMLHPYLAIGAGVYSMRLTSPDAASTNHDLEVGVNWGFGLDIQLARHFMLRGDISLHYLTGEVSNPVQMISLGGRFEF